MDEHLSKPIEPDEFFDVVERRYLNDSSLSVSFPVLVASNG